MTMLNIVISPFLVPTTHHLQAFSCYTSSQQHIIMARKRFYIIAGCNGSGKTTASATILSHALKCRFFVNADEIASRLSPLNADEVAISAGQIMLNRIDLLLSHRATFSIETTLASRSYSQLIKRAHKLGYKVFLIFFWLNNPQLAVDRVRLRVAEGGHNIDPDVIMRRYRLGIDDLFNIYMPMVDFWVIIDNSRFRRVNVAEGRNRNKNVTIHEINHFNAIKHYAKQ